MPLTNAVWKMKMNVKAQEEDESAQVLDIATDIHYTLLCVFWTEATKV